MKIIDCKQGSPEWYAAKCGVPSASNFDKVLTTKGAVSKSRVKYLYRLAGEVVTKTCEDTFQSMAMLRGKIMEAEARQYYQLLNPGAKVVEVGFCLAKGYGASPDALVDDDGDLEIKCPIMATHVSYLIADVVPPDYFQQMQGQLLVTGREWCDFMSYYPGLKPLLKRVYRDKIFLAALEDELKKVCVDLKEIVKQIQ